MFDKFQFKPNKKIEGDDVDEIRPWHAKLDIDFSQTFSELTEKQTKTPDLHAAKQPGTSRKDYRGFVMAQKPHKSEMVAQFPLTRALDATSEELGHGTAKEIFDLMFPTKGERDFCPWKDDHPEDVTNYLKSAHRQSILKHSTAREKRRAQRILENIQETLWLLHYQRQDELLEKCSEMFEISVCELDNNCQATPFKMGDYSVMLSENSGGSFVKRTAGVMLRTVVIDGLSILHQSNRPKTEKIPTNLLLHIIIHFTLHGYQTTIYFPDFYAKDLVAKVDDVFAFKFLIGQSLIKFEGVSDFSETVRDIAEEQCGILVTSENPQLTNAISCNIFVRKNINQAEQLSILHIFETDSDEVKFLPISHQLTLRRQVQLISYLQQFTIFDTNYSFRIRNLLMVIQRKLPDLLPEIMKQETIFEVEDALQQIRDGQEPSIWPIFADYFPVFDDM